MNAIRYPTSTAALRVMRGRAVGIHGRPAGGRHRRIVENAMKEGGKISMKLYFGNAVTTATTLMILALLGYIGVSRLEPRQYRLLGQENAAPAGVRSGRLLLCGGAGWAGQDHPAHHRRQLRTGRVSARQRSDRRRLCRCAADRRRRDRHTDRQNAENAGALVLWNVRRRGPEDRHHGDRAARALRPRGEFLDCPKRSVKTF